MRVFSRALFAALAFNLIAQLAFARRSVPSHAPIYYQVQQGDHLADVLRKFKITFLWGPVGAIQYTLELNPELQKNSGNELPIGTFIRIPTHTPIATESKTNLAHSKQKNVRSISAIEKTSHAPQKITFESDSDRHYQIYLVEDDGKKKHIKLEFDSKIQKSKKSDQIVYSFTPPEQKEISKAVEKKIDHFKDDFFATKKTREIATEDGNTIRQVYYSPWSIKEAFFFHFEGGGLLSSYKTTSVSGTSIELSSNPSLFAAGKTGLQLTDSFSFYLHGKGQYITLKSTEADISKATILVPKVGSGLSWKFHPRWQGLLQGAFTRDHIFSAETDNVEVTGVWRSMSTLQLDFDAWREGPHYLTTSFGSSYFFSKSTNNLFVDSSIGYFLESKYKLMLQEKIQIGGIIRAESRKQNSSLGVDQEYKFNLGLHFDWN